MKNVKDFYLLFFWNVIAFFISWHIGSNYLITITLFSLIPSLYLTIKKPSLLYKTSITSITLTIPFVFFIDYFAHADGAWFNPSVIGIRLFNFPVDDFIWGFFFLYYGIVFYEYFFDNSKRNNFPKVFKTFTLVTFVSTLIFENILILYGDITIPYFYIIFAVLGMILVPIYVLKNHPLILNKVYKTTIFFWFWGALYEYVANIKQNWFFPGHHFVGHVTILNVTIPFEEFLFVLLWAPTLICLYEIIADDSK